MLKHINEIANLDDEELDSLSTRITRHLKLCLICCLPIVAGMIIIPFGNTGVLEYIIVSLITLILGLFFGYLASNIRMVRYEKWRRTNTGISSGGVLHADALAR